MKAYHAEIDNVKLISVNAKYCKAGILSSKYRKCKQDLTTAFAFFITDGMLSGPLSMKIDLTCYGRADYDNFLKVIGDSLQLAGVIEDDYMIEECHIRKRPQKRGRMEKLIIDIREVE